MNSDPESSAYEEISDTRYYVVISVALAEYTYEFEKVSDSTINWILYPSGQIATLNKQWKKYSCFSQPLSFNALLIFITPTATSSSSMTLKFKNNNN